MKPSRPTRLTSSTGETGLAEPPSVPEIVSNVAGSFAWRVLHERHPALISQVRHAHPYQPRQLRALDRLLQEIRSGQIPPLPATAHDRAQWDNWGSFAGQKWADVPFLWAESYFYRCLLDAVDFFEPGPWLRLDPFGPMKDAELSAGGFADDLRVFNGTHALTAPERVRALLTASVWGNQADLGFRVGAATTERQVGEIGRLVADDLDTACSMLHTGRRLPKVGVVADNAGRELLSDLLLVDHLVETGLANHVAIHVKPHPYYVSDAVTADVVNCLRRLNASEGSAGDAGRRLWSAMRSGRVTVETHGYYCAPLPFHEMPPALAADLASTSLVLLKGDLNYRRLVGDRAWPSTTSFRQASAYFPAPVVALRTLKSDVVLGLDAGTVSTLEASGQAWRTSGRYGLVQARR